MKVISGDRYMSRVMSGEGLQGEPAMDIDGGLVILSDDGEVLYDLRLLKDGLSLEISSGSIVRVEGRIIDRTLTVSPCASNQVVISRPEYK